MKLELQQGVWGQKELSKTNASMILQSAWQRYASPEQNAQNILNAYPLIFQTCKSTGNFKLLGRIAPIIQKLKRGLIHASDTWFYSFLLMVEEYEIRSVGFRRQRYVVKERR
jgi:hypothetical protein